MKQSSFVLRVGDVSIELALPQTIEVVRKDPRGDVVTHIITIRARDGECGVDADDLDDLLQ